MISATTTTTTTTTPRPVPPIKPFCLKLLPFPVLLKIAKKKCFCPEFHPFYYSHVISPPQHYPYPVVLSNIQKPEKYRQTTPQLMVFRPTKAYLNFTIVSVTKRKTNTANVFNFKSTTEAPQVFNFRPTTVKSQNFLQTANPQLLINFPSPSSSQAFTGYSLNYHPSAASTVKQNNPVFVRPTLSNFNVFRSEDVTKPSIIPTEKPVMKLDFSYKGSLKVFSKK